MRRKVILSLLVLALAAVLPACQFAKVGARCSASQGSARNDSHVLFCVKGRWKASLTIGQAADFIVGTWPGSVAGLAPEYTATAGGAFPSLVVAVKTRSGQPAANTDVTFTATSGPGFAGPQSFSVRSNAIGTVYTWDTGASAMPAVRMGSGVGDVKVNITAGPLRDPVASFVLHVNGGTPTSLEAVTGRDQRITAGEAFQPWTFDVRDSIGNPVIASSIEVDGGALSGVSFSQSGGTITVTAGPQYAARQQQSLVVRATVAPKLGSAKTVLGYTTWTVVPGPPDDIDIDGDAQTAPVNTRFSGSLVVDVIDEYGNSVTGVDVTFTPIPAVSGASGTTTPNFNFNPFKAVFVDANNVSGEWTVRAEVAGLSTYDFTLTNF